MREKEIEIEHERELETEEDERQPEYELRNRKALIVLMALCTILESGLAGVLSGQALDRCIVLLFLGIIYSCLYFAGLELYRAEYGWFHKKVGNYSRLALCHAASYGASLLFLFLPGFARPILLFGVAASITASPFWGMASGIFHIAVYALCGQESVFMMICYLLLLLCGCLTPSFLSKKAYFHWGILFLFQFVFGNIMIFSYLQTGQLELNVLIYGLCNGIISATWAAILYQKFSTRLQSPPPREKKLERIIHEDFELVGAVKMFSDAEYRHAQKVSKIAENCALLIGANPQIAAAAGVYYRIGQMVGKPYVENGVALAKRNHLPKEVVEILSEYNGEEKLPSTLESAVVHIVDSIIGKIDILDKTNFSSDWNQDIVVYQTMNENSVAGMYDKSGFTMNMFLKIRDYLIKEAKTT